MLSLWNWLKGNALRLWNVLVALARVKLPELVMIATIIAVCIPLSRAMAQEVAASQPTTLPSIDVDPAGLFNTFVSGSWLVKIAVLIVVATFILRTVGKQIFPSWGSPRGGAIVALVVAVGGSVASALVSEKPINLNLFIVAVSTGFMAGGGWSMIKDILGIKAEPPPAPMNSQPPHAKVEL